MEFVEIEKLFDALQKKFSYDEDIKKLPTFVIPTNESIDKSITFIGMNKIFKPYQRFKYLKFSPTILVKIVLFDYSTWTSNSNRISRYIMCNN